MPRSLRLRSTSRSERRLLDRKLKDLSLAVRVHQRYRVVNEVGKGRTIAEAADRIGCHFTVAYDWVHRFNESGFATFEQVANPKGRPPILRAEQLRDPSSTVCDHDTKRRFPGMKGKHAKPIEQVWIWNMPSPRSNGRFATAARMRSATLFASARLVSRATTRNSTPRHRTR
jgi:hypothetical protein